MGSMNTKTSDCDRCDPSDQRVTYANQVSMPINGRVQGIDWCIHRLVSALNAANIRTTASCCGHGIMPGNITLEDGRIIAVFDGWEAARAVWPDHQWSDI